MSFSIEKQLKLFGKHRKLEFLFLANLSNQAQCFYVRLEPTQVKYLSGVPPWCKLPTLPVNIKLVRKNLLGTTL
jgi:hypothetical protein